jgi:hypothetical protein
MPGPFPTIQFLDGEYASAGIQCGKVETIEHLLCECAHYSQLTWKHPGELVTLFLNINTQDLVPWVEL